MKESVKSNKNEVVELAYLKSLKDQSPNTILYFN